MPMRMLTYRTFKTSIILCLCLFLHSACSSMDRQTRQQLAALNKAVEDKDLYAEAVQSSIDSLMTLIARVNADMVPEHAYKLHRKVYEVSHLYSFEYSDQSTTQMVELANRMGDAEYIAESRMLQAYNYARAGFFHEAQALLDDIHLDSVSDGLHAEFLIARGRVYHDLADYTHDRKYTPYYNNVGNRYLLQSLEYNTDSLVSNYVRGKVLLKDGQPEKAKGYYLKALELCAADDPKMMCILFSTLAHICRKTGDAEESTHYYMEASQICIKNAFRDVNSFRGLAEMLYNTYDDIDHSADFINLAVENAQAYGTRSRINNIGALMPLFVGQKLQRETTINHIFLTLTCFIAVLSILLLIVLRRYHARNLLLDQANHKLDSTNHQLEDANRKLEDANRMKDTYLGIFLDTQSELSLELNNFALVANQKIKMQQYDALKKLINQLEMKHNKAEVLNTFDRVFLAIYPTFIDEFNALLLPEHRMQPKTEGEMPAQMRIFALIRLGITDNKRIAGALNYSYNTVHNYRVRVRNMSPDAHTFEEKVARIGQ